MGQSLAPARISASWARSETYGAPTEVVDPAYTGTVDDESLFARCGGEVLAGLHEGLPGEPISLMLTDADGIVVSRLCDERALVDALDRTYLAPGFAFGEREAGTTGLGLALADRVPSLVRGDEHYCTGLWGYTCAAAPVLDPVDGSLLGSINLTTWSQRSDGLLLALARTAAGQTSALMLAHGRARARARRPAVRCSGSPRSPPAAPPSWAVAGPPRWTRCGRRCATAPGSGWSASPVWGSPRCSRRLCAPSRRGTGCCTPAHRRPRTRCPGCRCGPRSWARPTPR